MSLGFNKDFLHKNIYTKKLTIDSYDRNEKYIPENEKVSNPNNYQINLDKYPELQKNIIGLSLVAAFIPNSEYLINKYNHKFDILYDNTLHSIELTTGNYDPLTGNIEFVDHFKDVLQNKVSGDFNVIQTEDKNTVEIKHLTNDFTLLFESGPNCNSHINEILGLPKKDIESVSKVIETGVLALHPSKYVDITINEIPNIGLINNTKDNNNYIFDRVFLDNNYGNYKLHYNSDYDRIYNFFNPIELKNLTIKLFNDKNEIYRSNNLDNVITLEFILLKNDLIDKDYTDFINTKNFITKSLKQLVDNKDSNNTQELINLFNNNKSFNQSLIEELNQNNNEKLLDLVSSIKDNKKEKKETFNFNNLILIIIIVCLLIKIFIS